MFNRLETQQAKQVTHSLKVQEKALSKVEMSVRLRHKKGIAATHTLEIQKQA